MKGLGFQVPPTGECLQPTVHPAKLTGAPKGLPTL